MSEAIKGLKPQTLWTRFAEISSIPRPSKKEEKIAQYVLSEAKKMGLEVERDQTGNILVRKHATPDRHNSPSIAIQSHLDMVCEKNSNVQHDFDKDGITLVRKNGYIQAEGTTLGSDNGIGVAAALALFGEVSFPHGPLELLFTVDEETGLTGAQGLQPGFVKSRVLLNLDSEEDGALYVGCAGGRDTLLTLPVQRKKAGEGELPLTIEVTGLRGGHSGIDIDSGRGNAIKLLARILLDLRESIHLSSIAGGSKRNAIPREASADCHVPPALVDDVRASAEKWTQVFRNEFDKIEPGVVVRIAQSSSEQKQVFISEDQVRVVNTLMVLPHGVMRMSTDIANLVETSTNVATVTTGDTSVVFGTSQRSSVNTALDEIMSRVKVIGNLVGASAEQTDGYPGWKPNMESKALRVTKDCHTRLFGHEPEIKAIHAGLECGIIGQKYPGIDMVSFGPTITGAHSPDERVQIDTVDRFWKLLTAVLEKLSSSEPE